MRTIILFLFAALIVNSGFSSCSKNKDENVDTGNNGSDPNVIASRIIITAGNRTFNATLANSATGRAFAGRLPLTLNMRDLNRNEKFFDLTESLPTNASNPGSIASGDIMLYGSNTLVLFYKGFSTSFNYTRIGRVDNASDLEAALSTGNVTVTFAAAP